MRPMTTYSRILFALPNNISFLVEHTRVAMCYLFNRSAYDQVLLNQQFECAFSHLQHLNDNLFEAWCDFVEDENGYEIEARFTRENLDMMRSGANPPAAV